MGTVLDLLASALGERYRVEREIGAGGMATVFLAQDLKHARPVAIKVLRQEFASSASGERFLREIKFVAQLSHPNILPLFDSGTVGDLLFYVMPYVAEQSLRDRLKTGMPLPVGEAIRLAMEIADGLQCAHEQGVIHRDIKPENILMRRGHVMIADFGIGKALAESDEASVTITGMIMGTPTYMSPEQATGERVIDLRSDVYSLGCLLFEMLTGAPPFTGSNAYAILAKHTNQARPSARGVRGDVPASLDDVLHKALAVDATQRFASCAEFAGALSKVLHMIDDDAGTLRTGGTAGAITPWPALNHGGRRWRHERWFRVAVGVAACALIAAAVTGYRGAFHFAFAGAERNGFSDSPSVSPWRDKLGENYSVIGTLDSSLIVHRSRARALYTWSGGTWSNLAIPDSFELRPFEGQLHGGRLLATRRRREANGTTLAQLWWLELAGNALRPVEAISEFVPDETQPYWWYDGQTLITWLETVNRLSATGWTREPTGASGSIVTMWGRDASHRFAIADAPVDSLLVNDGLGWQAKDIDPEGKDGKPQYAGGVLLGDGLSIVFGERCSADARCRPLILQQDQSRPAWTPVTIPAGIGVPREQDERGSCRSRFEFQGASGRSVTDYYVWGEWDFCLSSSPPRNDVGCPRGQPCVWHVVAGRLEPVPDLVGKVLIGLSALRNASYALIEDGTVWRDTNGQWRPVAQLPNLPLRLVSASEQLVVMYTSGRLTYQAADRHNRLLHVRPFSGVPASLNDTMLPRRVLVRDSLLAMVAPAGDVFSTNCTSDVLGSVTCRPWQALARTSAPVSDVAVLADGGIMAVGAHGIAETWRNGSWTRELLPAEARRDSLWGMCAAASGAVAVVGRRSIAVRDPSGSWRAYIRPELEATQPMQCVLLPDNRIAIADGRIRIWNDPAAPTPPIELQSRVSGAGQVSALHVLADGRLVAGFANRAEPGVGGWLQVWATPTSDKRWQRVELPMNVDVSDLADDGQYLHVVGRGGSMAIPLTSLPFAPAR